MPKSAKKKTKTKAEETAPKSAEDTDPMSDADTEEDEKELAVAARAQEELEELKNENAVLREQLRTALTHPKTLGKVKEEHKVDMDEEARSANIQRLKAVLDTESLTQIMNMSQGLKLTEVALSGKMHGEAAWGCMLQSYVQDPTSMRESAMGEAGADMGAGIRQVRKECKQRKGGLSGMSFEELSIESGVIDYTCGLPVKSKKVKKPGGGTPSWQSGSAEESCPICGETGHEIDA